MNPKEQKEERIGVCAREECYTRKTNQVKPLFNGLCKDCNKIRNKGKAAAEKPNQVSIKQAAINRAYKADVDVWKAENPRCKANLTGCGKYTEDCHHKAGRGVNHMNKATWLPVCRNCHTAIESNPVFAKALGLSVSRLAKDINENQ